METEYRTPFAVRAAACVAYAGLVSLLSLAPSSALGETFLFPHSDKVAHFGMYAVYATLVAWSLERPFLERRRVLLCIALFCAAHGALLEILQDILRPGDRSFSVGDILANVAGSLAAAGVITRWAKATRDGTNGQNTVTQSPARKNVLDGSEKL